MFSSFRNKTTPIGIDIGVRSIKAVQLCQRNGKFELVAGLTLPIDPATPPDQQPLEQLERAMHRHGFRGKDVVIACPPAHLQSAIFELPPASSGAPLEKIAEIEMRRACKLETKEIQLAWWELPASSRQSSGASVMAVAATCEVTESIATRFADVGLDVAAIDTIPSALARSSAFLTGDGLAVVVDLGAEAGTVALTMSGRVIYERTIPEIGIDMLRRSIADELRLADDEADCVLERFGARIAEEEDAGATAPKRLRLQSVVRQHIDAIGQELESSLTYAAHKYAQLQVTHVLLCGGGARIGGITNEFTHRFRILPTVLTPDRVFDVVGHLTDIGSSTRHVIAAGLALNPVS